MAGRRCLAGSAVVAVGDAHDPSLDKLWRAAERMHLVYGLDPVTDTGPVVSDAAKEKITSFVEAGESEGAELVLGAVENNDHLPIVSEMPHGGYKQSGFGKDLSLHSVEDYTNLKHVYVDLTDAQRKGWHYIAYGKP